MKILITGGAGFIGSNVANYFASEGHEVVVFDNLSREGVIKNMVWLSKTHRNITFFENDIQEKDLTYALRKTDVVFHFAAQVGVQSSIENPWHDFMVNALGTFKLLEACRKMEKKPFVVFASTNKVYGDFETSKPVSEKQPLSFCTPYGCSKGAAEQYMLDYFRIFTIPTVVLRMSCVYGNRQFGTEEQGWLCHFMRNKEVSVYGDGTQVRDVLYIDDYVRLCAMLISNKEKVEGKVFNIGGGTQNTISVGQALAVMGRHTITYKDWRPSDQKYYVSEITKIKETIGWEPLIGVSEGLGRLEEWTKNL